MTFLGVQVLIAADVIYDAELNTALLQCIAQLLQQVWR